MSKLMLLDFNKFIIFQILFYQMIHEVFNT
jgi:hypothetical protein